MVLKAVHVNLRHWSTQYKLDSIVWLSQRGQRFLEKWWSLCTQDTEGNDKIWTTSSRPKGWGPAPERQPTPAAHRLLHMSFSVWLAGGWPQITGSQEF